MLAFCVTAGCILPGAYVTKNPKWWNRGVRYYRPKPYLFVRPARNSKVTEGEFSDRFVEISLEYLPDFSEEYAIRVTPGLGTANVAMKLEDGWNLTEISQDLDSQFDENVKAVGELLGQVGKLTPTEGKDTPNSKSMVVRSSSVPLGYYEAVVGRSSPKGPKRMYGWRYLGFAPFSDCPIQPCGAEGIACHDPRGTVYGLVFLDGVMVFRPLNEVRDFSDPTRIETVKSDVTKDTPDGGSLNSGAELKAIKSAVESIGQIKGLLGVAFKVEVDSPTAGTVRVVIRAPGGDAGAKDAVASEVRSDQAVIAAFKRLSAKDLTIMIETAETLVLPNPSS